MIEVRVKSNIELVSKALRNLGEQQLPKVFARAATITAYSVREKILEHVQKDFDRPTRETLRSLYVVAAKPGGKAARVWFKDSSSGGIPADKFLQPQVVGGKRGHKRFEKALIARGVMLPNEYAMPTRDVLDAYGNVSGGLSRRVLSSLAKASAPVATTAKGGRRKKAARQKFFAAKIGNTRGVWESRQTAFGTGIRPVFIFTSKAPTYKTRLDFFAIAEKVTQETYYLNFERAIDDAIRWSKEKK